MSDLSRNRSLIGPTDNPLASALIILFSLLESGYCEEDFVSSWADQKIASGLAPEKWLIEASLSRSSEESLAAVWAGLNFMWVSLPAGIDDLTAGFLLLRFDRGDLLARSVILQLIDLADAGHISHLNAEAAGTFDLNGSLSLEFRTDAKEALAWITGEMKIDTASPR